jgi:enoyl-CoA hydratase
MATKDEGGSVRCRVGAGGTGIIELDRPRALNALDLDMARAMRATLTEWRDDPAVRSVLVLSTSPKAFCAGGDILAVRTAGMRGDDDAVREYFGTEYALNAQIARYPKPYTALVDGYAMGGGLGISVHGSAVVATERAVFAMPETGIGFFPDIGASHFLPRLPGAVGWYLGLTGVRISGAAAVECGLATHYLPSTELPALTEELAATGEGPDAVLARYAVAPPRSELAGRRAVIARCFGAADLAGVRRRLAAEAAGGAGDARGVGAAGGAEGVEGAGGPEAADRAWAEETLEVLRRAGPLSLEVTFDLLRSGATASLEECLARELALACRIAREPDFHEGVRAALVDKDRSPVWSAKPA